MEYRLGQEEDISSICAMIASAIETMEQQGIYQWDEFYPTRADITADIRSKTLYTVTENDALVAIYVINREADPEYLDAKWECDGGTACIIHRLCVAPAVSHRGIGNTVLLHIEEQLRDLGYESVRLDVFSQNPYAIRLYEKNGYKRRGCADWRKGRFWLMEKRLKEE